MEILNSFRSIVKFHLTLIAYYVLLPVMRTINFIVIPETCEAVYLSLKVYFNNSNRVYVYDNFHEEHLQFLTFLSKINKHQDLASKRCSVPLCFRLFVGELVSYLRYLCLFAYGGVQHMLFVLFVFILCFVCPMLPVSLDCPFLIAPSVFSNVYLALFIICWNNNNLAFVN